MGGSRKMIGRVDVCGIITCQFTCRELSVEGVWLCSVGLVLLLGGHLLTGGTWRV